MLVAHDCPSEGSSWESWEGRGLGMGLCGRKAMGPKLKLLEAYDMRWVVQRRLSLGWDGAAEGNAAPVGGGGF